MVVDFDGGEGEGVDEDDKEDDVFFFIAEIGFFCKVVVPVVPIVMVADKTFAS